MNAMMTELLASAWSAPVLLVVKGTLVLLCAGVLAMLLRGAAPAARHLVWTVAIATLLVLPVAAWTVPAWRVPVVVQRATSPAEAATSAAPASSDVQTSPLQTSERVAAPAAARMSGARMLLLVWLAGACAVVGWMLIGRVMLHMILRRSQPVTDADWSESLRDAMWLLEVERPVRLYRSSGARMPVTWGVLRPVVVVPDEALTWDEERRRVVLLHELSHVVRRDCFTQLVASIACAVWWFHPGAWYAARRMRVEREQACDQLVLASGTAAPEYAAHLLELARRFSATFPSPAGLHMARASQLEGRLLAVLRGVSRRRVPGRAAVLVAALAALLVTLPLSAVEPVLQRATVEEDMAVAPPVVQDESTSQETQTPSPAPLDVSEPMVVDTPPAERRISVSTAGDSVARLVPRLSPEDAAYSITTRDGRTALLLRDTSMVLQLTDRGLAELGREKRTEQEDGFLTELLGTMLRSGLRMLLDRGIEYSLYDLREARVEDGVLVFESVSGHEVFDGVEMNGGRVMEQFGERDARAFAQRVNRARARLPR